MWHVTQSTSTLCSWLLATQNLLVKYSVLLVPNTLFVLNMEPKWKKTQCFNLQRPSTKSYSLVSPFATLLRLLKGLSASLFQDTIKTTNKSRMKSSTKPLNSNYCYQILKIALEMDLYAEMEAVSLVLSISNLENV
jgi:hypothetical protein